jgi:two-component system sensor histidine kinase KdpD
MKDSRQTRLTTTRQVSDVILMTSSCRLEENDEGKRVKIFVFLEGEARYWRFAVRVIAGALAVGLVTAVAYLLHLNVTIPAFLYLLVVVNLSLVGGFAEAAVVSVVAVGCLDYFLIPPALEWQITEPADTVGLITFWATSLVITRLVSNSRRQAGAAEKKHREAALLYDTASRLLALEPGVAAGTLSLQVFREVFGLDAACLYDGVTGNVLLEGRSTHNLSDLTRAAYFADRDYRDADRNLDIRCLHVAGKLTGAIGFEGRLDDEYTTGSLSLMAATALERERSFRQSAEALAAAESETLRSAILDALAHEFKTPLGAILAAAGGLRESGALRPDQLEMTELIESESSRLGRLAARLLRMARLDRDEVKPNLEVTDLRVLVSRLGKEYETHFNEHQITLSMGPEPAEVMSDPELLNLALAQLLDNAVKYSLPGTAINVELCRNNGSADVLITSRGNSIRPEYRERIFDRFFRGRNTRQDVTSGTGLGLYVARKIARAHSGTLVLDRAHVPDDQATTFRMTLPIVHRESDPKESDHAQQSA